MDLIQKLIKNNQIGEAIEKVLEWYKNDKDIYESAILISSRYKKLQKEWREGLVSREEYYQLSAQISHSILEVSSSAEEKGITPSYDKPFSYKYVIPLILLFMLLALYLVKYNAYPDKQKPKENITSPPIIEDTSIIDSTPTIKPKPRIGNVDSPPRIKSPIKVKPQININPHGIEIPSSLLDSIKTIEVEKNNADKEKEYEIFFSYSTKLNEKDRERNTFNFQGGHLILKINNESWDLEGIKLRAYEDPNGYRRDVIEKLVLDYIEEMLKNKQNELSVWKMLEAKIK